MKMQKERVIYKRVPLVMAWVLLLSGMLYAGGKYTVPAESKVIPIVAKDIPLYIGFGLVGSAVSRDCACADSSRRLKDITYGGILRVGWDFNEYIGIEARGIKARIEKDFSETKHYGLFVKPHYFVSRDINLYGLIGYGRTTVECSSQMTTSSLSLNAMSYGTGVEYHLFRHKNEINFVQELDREQGWGLWMDFQHFLYRKGPFKTNANVVTLGVTYDF